MVDLSRVFPGDTEMSRRMRAFDWNHSPLGSPATWPDSLRTSVRIVLTSRHPMFVWWGEQLINLYNDAAADFLQGRHPAALGQSAAEVWPDIWEQVGPGVDRARRENACTSHEVLRLIMLREGHPEECYITFSCSPIPNDDGNVGGVLCPVIDHTQAIVGERQLALLRELASRTATAGSSEDACRRAIAALATNPADLPFALIYLFDGIDDTPTITAHRGLADGQPVAADHLAQEHRSIWPIADAMANGRHVVVSDLSSIADWLPVVRAGFRSKQAVVIPLPIVEQQAPTRGVLVAGLTPLRRYDDDYTRFLDLVAGGIASGIVNARVYEREQRLAEVPPYVEPREGTERTLDASPKALEHGVHERTAALRSTEEKYHGLLDTIDEGVGLMELVRDERGEIRDFIFRHANASFERHSRAQRVVGRTVGELLPHLKRHWIDTYTHVNRTGEPTFTDNYVPDIARWYRMHHSRVGDSGSAFVAVIFENITARKRAEITHRESGERQAFLLNLSDALRPLSEPVDVQAVASRMIGEQLGVSRAFYYRTERGEKGHYIHVVEKDFTRDAGARSMIGRYPQIAFGESVFDDLRRGQTIAVYDVNRLSVLTDTEVNAYRAVDVAAFVAAPVVKSGEYVGGIMALTPVPRNWTEQDIAVVRESAERTWAEVERARAHAALLAGEARLSALIEALPIGVALLDGTGKAVILNTEMLRFLPTGLIPSPDDESHRRWRAWHADGRVLERRDFPTNRALRGTRVVPGVEMLYTNHEGRDIWTRVAAVPIRNEAGHVVGAIATLTDINELKQMNDQLETRVRERTREIKELFARLLSAQEEERRRVARDIHDQLGQPMTALRMNLEALHLRANDGLALAEHTARTQRLAEELDQSIDFLIGNLRPAALDLGLAPAVRSLAAEWSHRFHVDADVIVSDGDDVRLPRNAEENLYRLVQEALHNVVKHAHATHVTVILERRDHELIVMIEDDGRGFDSSPRRHQPDGTGLGMVSMRERAALVGGRLKITSVPGRGTSVSVSVPLS